MLILGSSSPRRKEILGFFKLPFEQSSPPFDEDAIPFTGDPVAYTRKLSEGKALSLREHFPQEVILTADTVVFKEGKLFCKPKSSDENLAMLREFNGKWQTVFTSVTAACGNKQVTEYAQTHLLFHDIEEEQLMHYYQAFSGQEMAGGYGVQMGGSIIIKRMEGCFYNVMGLPITATRSVLKEMGIDLWRYL